MYAEIRLLSFFSQVEEKNGDGEDDEDEWEDASDGDGVEEVSDSEQDSRGDEKKDTGKEKPAKSKDNSPTSPTPRSRPTSGGSPKEQRTPRPKVHIPPPGAAQESPEGGKPLSPFSPLDHQPVSDWGEEMELLSPRSSMGGESPLKPPSTEASPPQKKDLDQEQDMEETESKSVSSDRTEPQKEEGAGKILIPLCSISTVISQWCCSVGLVMDVVREKYFNKILVSHNCT